jgi:acetyltransferase-like isoleucine patch superfamily enzyme
MNQEPTHVHRILRETNKSALQKYRELAIGETGFLYSLFYEFCITLFSAIPGGIGYASRRVFFPALLKQAGSGIVFGRSLTLRHPRKVALGHNVNLGDLSTLDAFGYGSGGIRIGDNVLIGRNTMVATKGGEIQIEEGTNIGANCLIYARDTEVKIGRNTLIAANSYVMGGGVHGFERTDIPITEQNVKPKGISIGDNTWIGAFAAVADGARIGKECVIGAMSFVNGEIPDWSVAYGIPAQVMKKRK